MFLTLDSNLVERLKSVKLYPNEVIEDFCRVSIRGLVKPVNPKLISATAGSLKEDEDVVKKALEAISILFLQASKMQLSRKDLLSWMRLLGFSKEASCLFGDQYETKQLQLRILLCKQLPTYRHFSDLEWRFDIKLTSRSACDLCQPAFLFNIHTHTNKPQQAQRPHPSEQGQTSTALSSNLQSHYRSLTQNLTCESFVLECSPATLSHVLIALQEALRTSRKTSRITSSLRQHTLQSTRHPRM